MKIRPANVPVGIRTKNLLNSNVYRCAILLGKVDVRHFLGDHGTARPQLRGGGNKVYFLRVSHFDSI
jgi:hypothetical protein